MVTFVEPKLVLMLKLSFVPVATLSYSFDQPCEEEHFIFQTYPAGLVIVPLTSTVEPTVS
jgi:hypothetical protein